MQFKEIIAVYSENRIKRIKQNTTLQIFKIDGTYNYHWDFKD
jgi:hypothetical protein